MHIARSLLSPGVCPFVTCIVSEVYCIMAEDIGKLLSGPGSPTILLLTPAPVPSSTSGGAKYTW